MSANIERIRSNHERKDSMIKSLEIFGVYIVMTALLGLCIWDMIEMFSGASYWILITFITAICGFWMYLADNPNNYKRHLIRNIAASVNPFMSFDFSSIADGNRPESMLGFLHRRMKEDFRKYSAGGQVWFWGMRVVLVLTAFSIVTKTLFGLDSDTVFTSIVFSGSISCVLAYFGYLSVWSKTEKEDLGEIKECAISIWKNMYDSNTNEGFKIYKFSTCAIACTWTIIDGSKLEMDFRIFDPKTRLNNMSDEVSEMKQLLEEEPVNWWDRRIVIKVFKDKSYSKMIEYPNVETSKKRPLRVCEIDGNHRSRMKHVMETIQMLKSDSMRARCQTWIKIHESSSFKHYDPDLYEWPVEQGN